MSLLWSKMAKFDLKLQNGIFLPISANGASDFHIFLHGIHIFGLLIELPSFYAGKILIISINNILEIDSKQK